RPARRERLKIGRLARRWIGIEFEPLRGPILWIRDRHRGVPRIPQGEIAHGRDEMADADVRWSRGSFRVPRTRRDVAGVAPAAGPAMSDHALGLAARPAVSDHALGLAAGAATEDAPSAAGDRLTALRADPRQAIEEDRILCLICGQAFRQLTNTHLRFHSTSPV